MRRVLLVSYEFPPMGGVGVQRPTQFAKQLPNSGWDVTVITVEDSPTAVRDESLLAELPASTRVRRAWSPEPTRVIQALRRMKSERFRSTDMPTTSRVADRAGYSGMPAWVIQTVQALFIPDEKRLWRGPARRAGLAAITEDGVTAIISSGPPFTAHLIAYDIARATGLPWIADFRDPWVGNYFFRPATPLHAWLQARWERRVVANASSVLVVSEPMARDLRDRHRDLAPERFVVIPNGFDPAELPSVPAAAHNAFTVAYLGTFQGGINPEVFLGGLRSVIDSGVVPADGVEFRVIGPSGEVAIEAARIAGVAGQVTSRGFLPHAQALEAAASADVMLLILEAGEMSRPIITGKLLEYLGLGKTVLALVPNGAAADLVVEAGAGIVVDPSDRNAVAGALGELYRLWREGELPIPRREVVERFDRRRQMAQVASLLDRMVAGRRP